VSIDGKVLSSETVELGVLPVSAGQTVKRVQLSGVISGDVIVLTPVVRDSDKVKSAIMKIWRLPAEGDGLAIDFENLPPPMSRLTL